MLRTITSRCIYAWHVWQYNRRRLTWPTNSPHVGHSRWCSTHWPQRQCSLEIEPTSEIEMTPAMLISIYIANITTKWTLHPIHVAWTTYVPRCGSHRAGHALLQDAAPGARDTRHDWRLFYRKDTVTPQDPLSICGLLEAQSPSGPPSTCHVWRSVGRRPSDSQIGCTRDWAGQRLLSG